MKISVRYEGQCYIVPVGDGTNTIGWLIEETLKRASKSVALKPVCIQINNFDARFNESHGILSKDDIIKDVLEDKDLIYIGEAVTQGRSLPVNDISSLPTTYKYVQLDGNGLRTKELVQLGKGELKIQLTDESWDLVRKSRDLIDSIIADNKVVYGVTTGFGKFARVVIPKEKLKALQENLIRSHAAGVGEPLTVERARSVFALRINVLAKGYSGISPDTLGRIIEIFNAGCVSKIPEKGTVGASGDLAPLAHLALGLIGEGEMWGPKTGWSDAGQVLSGHGLAPLDLKPKEGLAMINGTQLITALGNEALVRAATICKQADVVAAVSLEVLKGTTKAFSKEIHAARPHRGQSLVASRLRSLLHSEVYRSEIAESHRFCNRVQDAYTLRCCPQVHGIVHDTIEFVHGIISTEINSATDNPMVFADLGETMSGGNFHGEYPAKALDYLAIGIHELANMSERRLERLINPAYSELPAFLTKDGGLNSGFMLAQCTAAALVSENKVLTHPSSVDSLSTSAGTEDHVSMGGFSARKALTVVEHVEYVLAIELLAACQGIEFLRPLKTTEPLEAVYRLVRSVVKPFDSDRYMAPDIEEAHKLLRDGKVWEAVKPYMDNYRVHQKRQQSTSTYPNPDSPTSYSHPATPLSGLENGESCGLDDVALLAAKRPRLSTDE